MKAIASIFGFIIISSCALAPAEKTAGNFPKPDTSAVNDCINRNGTWDYEYGYCKGAEPVVDGKLQKKMPWLTRNRY